MARIELIIADPSNHLTLRTILDAEGHEIVQHDPEAVIAGLGQHAIERAGRAPTIVIATASEVPEAVKAMKQGVYGYLFLPFQPAEASLMIARALEAGRDAGDGAWASPPEDVLTLEEAETMHIRKVLRLCSHNRAKAARLLGIGRNTLWRKLKKADSSGQSVEPSS